MACFGDLAAGVEAVAAVCKVFLAVEVVPVVAVDVVVVA